MPVTLPLPKPLWDTIPLAAQTALLVLFAQQQQHLAQQQEALAVLQARVEELTAKLNLNSSNSSKPPSSDPPHLKPAPKRTPSGKKQGGQPGHPKHERERLPPDRVIDLRPCTCGKCGLKLTGDDPEPDWRQVVELPVVKPVVTEYQLHCLKCTRCGTLTTPEIPAEAQHAYGPHCQALVAVLSGQYRLSARCRGWGKICLV